MGRGDWVYSHLTCMNSTVFVNPIYLFIYLFSFKMLINLYAFGTLGLFASYMYEFDCLCQPIYLFI